jgi:anti-sigma B factor antagonist
VTGRADQGDETVSEQGLRVTIETRHQDGDPRPVLKVSGEIDIQTSPVLEEQLRLALDRGDTSLVVDLGDVSFLDSTGLSVLVGALQRCRAAGGDLRLVAPQPNVRRVLDITGLAATFHVEGGDGSGKRG